MEWFFNFLKIKQMSNFITITLLPNCCFILSTSGYNSLLIQGHIKIKLFQKEPRIFLILEIQESMQLWTEMVTHPAVCWFVRKRTLTSLWICFTLPNPLKKAFKIKNATLKCPCFQVKLYYSKMKYRYKGKTNTFSYSDPFYADLNLL